MHFKTHAEIKALYPNAKIWPGNYDRGPMRFMYDRNRVAERHTCDVPLKNGKVATATRHLIPVKDGRWLNVSIAAYNAIKFALRHLAPEQLDRSEVVLSLSGDGLERRYRAHVSFPEPAPVETLKAAAESGGLPPGTHLMFLGPPRKNVIIDNLMDPPTAKTVCRCDVKDLLSTGHTPGCPEKRR